LVFNSLSGLKPKVGGKAIAWGKQKPYQFFKNQCKGISGRYEKVKKF
jgi:hypothetical protein